MKSKLMIGFFALTTGSFGLVGCGGSDDGEVTKVEGTNTAKYATATITLPMTQMASAFDLDGDGTPENKLGTIVGGLVAAKLPDPQISANDQIMAGKLVILLEETSSDPTQQDAKNAGVKLSIANASATPPNYDGKDTFTANTGTTPAQFFGNIVGGTFTSNNPATTTHPVSFTLILPIVSGSDPIVAPVTAGRITFKRGADGKITGGQINCAIRKEDVETSVLPSVAALITKQVNMMGASDTVKMFDINKDGTVTVEELKASPIIAGFLGPDIQLFQDGVYKPNPDRTNKDSLSLGLAFTAVGASF